MTAICILLIILYIAKNTTSIALRRTIVAGLAVFVVGNVILFTVGALLSATMIMKLIDNIPNLMEKGQYTWESISKLLP